MVAVRLASLLAVLASATTVVAQDMMMLDPRIVDDGAKASLIVRTDPNQAAGVMRQCAATAQQVASGVRQQGQINLAFCAAFEVGVASIAAHDRSPSAATMEQVATRDVTSYLAALGASRGQIQPTMAMLRQQVAGRLRVYSPG